MFPLQWECTVCISGGNKMYQRPWKKYILNNLMTTAIPLWELNPGCNGGKPALYQLSQDSQDGHLFLKVIPALNKPPYLTLVSSAFLIPVCNSVNSGSTLVWMMISFPRAAAAFSLTDLLGSLSALTNVVCNWGKNGFNITPTYNIMTKHVISSKHQWNDPNP